MPFEYDSRIATSVSSGIENVDIHQEKSSMNESEHPISHLSSVPFILKVEIEDDAYDK